MVRVIMGEKGTGKTKKLIELINDAASQEAGNVVCIEAEKTMTFDIHYHVRLIVAGEYPIASYEAMRGFISGLYAGNYDISHIFIDNLLSIVDGKCDHEAEKFLDWAEKFSADHGVRFTVSMSEDPAHATDGIKKYL
ncbi:MAG: ATP-binding protein [Ruminococcaceae bacterium]|nr:ATP-binding protein [Oscillospiraceae bacterium]